MVEGLVLLAERVVHDVLSQRIKPFDEAIRLSLHSCVFKFKGSTPSSFCHFGAFDTTVNHDGARAAESRQDSR